MSVSQFKGFAGIVLKGERQGDPDDPLVLLVHGGGQTRAIWNDTAAALVRAGRQVISIDLRGHGESEWPADARYDFGAYVEDLRAVLAQLPSRPVIVGASLEPRGEALEEADRANLHEGRWYLRTRDAPAVTIERFRMLLGLEFETGPEVKLSPEEP